MKRLAEWDSVRKMWNQKTHVPEIVMQFPGTKSQRTATAAKVTFNRRRKFTETQERLLRQQLLAQQQRCILTMEVQYHQTATTGSSIIHPNRYTQG